MSATSAPPARILAVDDDPAALYAISRILHAAGFEVLEAASGAEALQLALEDPDLVVLDVQLPDMDGFEVCRRLRANPATQTIAILHMSATHKDYTSQVRGLEGGADGYLVQPVEGEVLVSYVRALLRVRSAERDARRAARDWQETFDAIKDGVCLLDAQGRVRRANMAMEAIVGEPAADLIGKVCWQAMNCGTSPPEDCLFRQVIVSKNRADHLRQVGDRWYKVTLDPILDAKGEIKGAVHIMSDVTALKKLERRAAEARKTEAIASLAGGIAHEFNNSLQAVIGNLDLLLLDFGDNQELRQRLEAIGAAARHMAQLTSTLTSYSRGGDYQFAPMDLGNICREAAELARRQVPEGIKTRVTVEPELPLANVDAGNIHVVLAALINNAVEAISGAGEINISVSKVNLGDGQEELLGLPAGQYVRLRVADTGEGMDESTLEQVFDPFFTTKFYGRGLSMASVQRIIHDHQGEVVVSSTPGAGTTIDIYLPVAAVEAGEA